MKIIINDYAAPPFDPEKYILDEGLKNAIEVAIALDQPLLLTGEPGTGKTRLAYKVAHELAKQESAYRFAPQPLVFNTKTTSTARDLFYTYDALAHFQAANIKRETDTPTVRTADYLELQALGKAIAQTDPAAVDSTRFNTRLAPEPQSAVVLIDEIDKAPRDFTNDILDEIESYRFRIKEQNNYPIKANREQRIVVVMTSNSERNLPDAFLRRCVFYHIPFPSNAQLLEIVRSQLGGDTRFAESFLDECIRFFETVRRQSVRKPPATAELMAWLRILELREVYEKDEGARNRYMIDNLAVLIKTREDMEAIREHLQTEQNA